MVTYVDTFLITENKERLYANIHPGWYEALYWRLFKPQTLIFELFKTILDIYSRGEMNPLSKKKKSEIKNKFEQQRIPVSFLKCRSKRLSYNGTSPAEIPLREIEYGDIFTQKIAQYLSWETIELSQLYSVGGKMKKSIIGQLE